MIHHGDKQDIMLYHVKKCRFSLICPSLSDYEYVLGKANLCHIVNDEKNEY